MPRGDPKHSAQGNVMARSVEIHLVKRPDGMPRESDFAAVERTVADVRDGEIQIQNLFMSVDPAMRPRLSRGQELNEAVGGPATGRVTQSRNSAFKEGDIVQHRMSFRQYRQLRRQGRVEADRRSGAAAHGLHACARQWRLRRLWRPARDRQAQGRRTGVRLHRRRIGRLDRRPDRQDQGLLRDRLDRLRRQGGLAEVARARRRHQLQEGADPRRAEACGDAKASTSISTMSAAITSTRRCRA